MENKSNPLALIGMIAGIASLVFFILGFAVSFFSWLSLILGIGGLVCSIIGRKNPNGKGQATAGLVCSIITLALFLIVVIIVGILLASL